MLLWMHDFFLNAYMMYVWMIFFLWENAFMKSWTFSFWKCIYECMIFFNAYIVHVWKIFSKNNAFMNAWFLFEYIYDVCLNDFFLWENAFMKSWTFCFWKYIYEWMIFLDLFLFSFRMYACIIFFWECIYKWNFWECVYDVRNSRYSQADFIPWKIQAWKSIFFSFKFSIFFNNNAWMDAWNCNF